MKNIATIAFAIITAFTFVACDRFDEMPTEESEVNPLVNADATLPPVNQDQVTPCGEWEAAVLINRSNKKFGSVQIANDANYFYFWVDLPDLYQIDVLALYNGELAQVPSIDGQVILDEFQEVRIFDEPTHQDMIRVPRSSDLECTGFAMVLDIRNGVEDENAEGGTFRLFMEGRDVADIQAV